MVLPAGKNGERIPSLFVAFVYSAAVLALSSVSGCCCWHPPAVAAFAWTIPDVLQRGSRSKASTLGGKMASTLGEKMHFERASKLYASDEDYNGNDNAMPPSSSAAGGGPTPRKKKNLKTFQRYLEIESWKQGGELRKLEPVLLSVAESFRQINRLVARAQTDDLYGVAVDPATGERLEANVQGEVQQLLDVLCNTYMKRAFCGSSRSIHSIASEEEDEPRCCSDVMVSTGEG